MGPIFFALLLVAAARALPARWDEADIRASRRAAPACALVGDAAALASNDLIVAVREGGRELLLLEAATLSTRARCQLPQALRGSTLRSPDGRYVYAATAEGWVLRLDLQDPRQALRTRSGLRLSGLALSADGRWLLAGHAQPHTLVLLDAELQPARLYRAQALGGGASSAVASVWNAGARRSFIVSFQELPELWELSYDPAAPPIHDGRVHDYRMGEALASAGFLGVRRTPPEQPLALLLGDATLRHVLATPRPEASASGWVDVVNLDIRRRIGSHAVPGRPRAGSGVAFTAQQRAWLAYATQPEGRVMLLQARDWQLHPELLTALQGVVAIHTHAEAPQLWLQCADAEAPVPTLALIDKRDFRTLANWRAPAGSSWAGVSFASGGRRAVLATRGPQGDVRLVDTRTLQTLQRVALPHVHAVFALDAP